MIIPGMDQLLRSIKSLEDHARAYRNRDELQMELLTREELEVIESFRKFRTEQEQ